MAPLMASYIIYDLSCTTNSMWNLLKDNITGHKADQSRAALSLVGWRKNVWQKLDAVINTEQKKAIYVDSTIDITDYFQSLLTLRSVISVDTTNINLDQLKIIEEAECAIFILDTELSAWEAVFERVIHSTRALQMCRVYCTQSSEAHSGTSDAYLTYSSTLHNWMSKHHRTANVRIEHLPLAFTERLVEHVTGVAQPVDVLVSHCECFPVIEPQWKDAQDRIDVDQLPASVKRDLKHCVHALKDMLHVLDVKLSTDHVDCYVLGATADLIGNELMAVIAQHSAQHEHESHGADIGPVSLLLIDRTLDLVAPAKFGADNVMDSIQALIDAQGNDLSALLTSQSRGAPQLDLPHELRITWPVHVPIKAQEQQLLSALVSKKSKEVLVEVKRVLTAEIARDKPVNVSHSAPSVKSALEQLKGLVAQCPEVAFTHHHVLLLMRAALTAVQSRDTDRYHAALTLIVRLTLSTNLRTGHRASFAQFMELVNQTFINSSAPRDPARDPHDITVISARDFILLCVLYCSLTETQLGWEDTAQIKKFLVTTLLNFRQPEVSTAPSTPSTVVTTSQARPATWLNATLREQLDRVVTHATNDEEAAATRQQVQLELEDEIERVIDTLTAITTLRAGLRDYRSLMKDASTGIKNYTALTRQVLDHVLNQREHELTDLKKLSYSIKGLLKKGFSKFGFHSKPRPTDNKNLIVFVIGGITWSEVKELKEVFQQSPHTQHTHLLIASTSITSADQLFAQLFRAR